MWTTKIAGFASKCRRCGGTIKVGQAFRYGRMPGMPHGVGYHLRKDCPSDDATKAVEPAQPFTPAEPAKPAVRQPANVGGRGFSVDEPLSE